MDFIPIWAARIGLASLAAGIAVFVIGVATTTPALLVGGLAAVDAAFLSCIFAMRTHDAIQIRAAKRAAR